MGCVAAFNKGDFEISREFFNRARSQLGYLFDETSIDIAHVLQPMSIVSHWWTGKDSSTYYHTLLSEMVRSLGLAASLLLISSHTLIGPHMWNRSTPTVWPAECSELGPVRELPSDPFPHQDLRRERLEEEGRVALQISKAIIPYPPPNEKIAREERPNVNVDGQIPGVSRALACPRGPDRQASLPGRDLASDHRSAPGTDLDSDGQEVYTRFIDY